MKYDFRTCKKPLIQKNNLLKDCNYDFAKSTTKEHHTVMTPRSEFREFKVLEMIWKTQKDWSIIKASIEEGCSYPWSDSLLDKYCLLDLELMLTWGNHLSTMMEEASM